MTSSPDRVWAVFEEAMALAGEERTAFLDRACGEDSDLRTEIDSLLQHHDEPLEALATAAGVPAPAPQTGAPKIPDRIGDYRIVRKIGEGGMGIVYEAEQTSPKRRVALKVMRPLLGGGSLEQRFAHEAAMLGMLQHPGIARIYEAGTFDGGYGTQPFFAMELIEGRSLTEYATEHSLSVRQRLELMVAICDAAHYAHQHGVIHRDLKPDNILVTCDGRPIILDFGVARAIGDEGDEQFTQQTMAGQVIGTLAYMSPEQIRGRRDELAICSDVYSLGVICYELLTGELPLDLHDQSIADAVDIVSHKEATRIGSVKTSLRGDLETIVAKALQKEKPQRYQTAADFGEDIRRFLSHEPIVAREPSTFYQLRKFARRNRALVTGVAIAMLAIVAGGVLAVWFAVEAIHEREASRAQRLHRVSLPAAVAAMQRGHFDRAKVLLDEAPVEHRNFEYEHVRARLSPWEDVLVADADIVSVLVYSPDGRRLMTVLADGTIGVWDTVTGKLSRPFSVPDGTKITAIARNLPAGSSLGGVRLAAGTEDGRIFVWPIDSSGAVGGERTVRQADKSKVTHMAWSPQGDLFSATAAPGHCLTRWHGGDLTVADRVSDRLDANIRDLVVAPDGQSVALCWPGGMGVRVDTILWQLHGGVPKRIDYDNTKNVLCLAFMRDGRHLVVGTRFQQLQWLDARTMQRVENATGGGMHLCRLRVSPDGQELAAFDQRGVVRFYDARTREPRGVLRAARGLAQLAYRPDGGALAVGLGKKVVIHCLPSSESFAIGGLGGNVRGVGWSPCGSMLVVTVQVLVEDKYQQRMRVLSADTGEVVLAREGGAKAVAGDARRLYGTHSPNLRALDLATGKADVLGKLGGAHFFPFLKWARQHRALRMNVYLDLAGDPATMRYIDWPDGNEVKVKSVEDSRVLAALGVKSRQFIDFGRHGKHIFVADHATKHRVVRIFDARTYAPVGEIPEGVHTDEVFNLDVSPDGTRFATACKDHRVRIFDSKSLQLLLELDGHISHVACLQFSPDGTRLASGGGDDTVRIWDTVPREERHRRARAAMARRAKLKDVTPAALDDASLTAQQRGDILRVLIQRWSKK